MKKTILIISSVLFVLSLTQKCYCTVAQCSDSIMVFLLGWFAVLTSFAGISWLANPLLFAAWLMLRKNLKASMILSMLATLFALSFLLVDSIAANENGQSQQIVSHQLGYWLWLLSCTSTLLGTFIIKLKQNTNAS